MRRSRGKGSQIWSLAIVTMFMFGSLLVLVPTTVQGDEAEMDPLWSYTTGDDIGSTSLSADGKYMAVGSYDSKVYLFEKGSSTPLWSYDTDGGKVAVDISADGEYIVAGAIAPDSKVYLFNKTSSKPLWDYNMSDDAYTVAISNDGEYLIAGSKNGKICFFQKNNSKPLWTHTASDQILSIHISADGSYAGAGSMNDDLYFFDRAYTDSSYLWKHDAGGDVWSVSLSADAEYLAAGTLNGDFLMFHKDNSTPLWTYSTGESARAALSADGEYLIGTSYTDTAYFFHRSSSTPRWMYTGGDNMRWPAISDDGSYSVVGCNDHNIYLFDKDFTDDKPVWKYITGDTIVRSMPAISTDGKYIAGGSHDNKAYFFQRETLMIESEASYIQGELVTIKGAYAGETTDITFQVKDPADESYLGKTIETNEDSWATLKFTLEDDDPVGTYTIYATNNNDDAMDTITFEVKEKEGEPEPPHIIIKLLEGLASVDRGQTLNMDFTIENTFDTAQDMTLMLQLSSPSLRHLRPAIEKKTVDAETTPIYTLSVAIPSDAEIGDYILQGQMLTDLPENTGYALDYVDGSVEVT